AAVLSCAGRDAAVVSCPNATPGTTPRKTRRRNQRFMDGALCGVDVTGSNTGPSPASFRLRRWGRSNCGLTTWRELFDPGNQNSLPRKLQPLEPALRIGQQRAGDIPGQRNLGATVGAGLPPRVQAGPA